MGVKKNLKILVVDDNKGVRSFLNVMFTGKNFVVEEAGNGKEALKKVIASKPDIILLDGTMPEMDGFETCRRLRENQKTKNIPVIFCTSICVTELIEREVELDDYIEKPFDVNELCKKINKVLKKRD